MADARLLSVAEEHWTGTDGGAFRVIKVKAAAEAWSVPIIPQPLHSDSALTTHPAYAPR